MAAPTWITAGFAGVLFGVTLLGADGAGDFRASPAYQQLLESQSGVQSSIADIEVHTKMRGLLPISLTFRGHSYFRAPDQQTVVFDNIPGILKGMVKNKPTLQTAAMWPRYYQVRVDGDDGGATTFHLVPIDSRLRFVNTNGPEVTTEQTYGEIERHAVIIAQAGETHGAGYKADITTAFTGYQINVPVPESVFSSQ